MKKRIVYIILILTVQACSVRSGLEAIDLSETFVKESNQIYPDLRIHRISDSVTEVYYRINSEELLYVRPAPGEDFQASARVEAFVYEDYNQHTLIDSAGLDLNDRQQVRQSGYFNGKLTLHTPVVGGKDEYVLLLRVLDKNRKMYFHRIAVMNRRAEINEQDFLLTRTSGEPVFNAWVAPGDSLRIETGRSLSGILHVNRYDTDFKPAPPPYVEEYDASFNIEPDSTYAIRIGEIFVTDEKGFLFLHTGRNNPNGLAIYVFDDVYPQIAKKNQLSKPMRYITTNLEYEGLDRESPDTSKIEVDKFWIDRAGTPGRAAYLIKEFYSRVETANRHFTSYKEGWKTDRGILFVVYGPPSAIYKSADTETWIYGEEHSALNFTFVFDREDNLYTRNDYTLRRLKEYRYGWGLAIDAWRNGNIFNVQDIKQAQNERDHQLRSTASPYLWN